MSDNPLVDLLKPIMPDVDVTKFGEEDRQKLGAITKLQLLMAEAKQKYGRDPRGCDHFVIVGRPRVVLQMLIDLPQILTSMSTTTSGMRFERPVIAGTRNADCVGWWENVPVIVRCTVVDDKLYCLPKDKVPEDTMLDRRTASEIRLCAHKGPDALFGLRERG